MPTATVTNPATDIPDAGRAQRSPVRSESTVMAIAASVRMRSRVAENRKVRPRAAVEH
jgi:hypothetical protein